MAANPQGSNPFATNNSGGGFGTRTAMPSVFGNTTQMMQSGQYTPYQTPDWILGGLQQSSMPIQNYPVQNFGRWNWNNGAYNGQGMSGSPWPSASSITQPYGQQGGMQGAAQPGSMGKGGSAGGTGMSGGPGSWSGLAQQVGGPVGGWAQQPSGPGGVPPQGLQNAMQQSQFPAGVMPQAAAGTAPHQDFGRLPTGYRSGTTPDYIQQQLQQFQAAGLPQQQEMLQNNMRLRQFIDPATINNLLGGSTNQTMSGQLLR